MLFRSASLAIGGHLLKQHIEALIEGEGANSLIRGIALGDAEQHFDFVTLQDHVGPSTSSVVEVKSALAGASRQAYYGVTRVSETAKGADADQTNRNLLISGESKADSDPVLEILTADVVRCGHHAAVGPVDPEALFYLESRGIPAAEARARADQEAIAARSQIISAGALARQVYLNDGHREFYRIAGETVAKLNDPQAARIADILMNRRSRDATEGVAFLVDSYLAHVQQLGRSADRALLADQARVIAEERRTQRSLPGELELIQLAARHAIAAGEGRLPTRERDRKSTR